MTITTKMTSLLILIIRTKHSVNLHSMIKLMLTFVNSGLRKTMIIIKLNSMPKHPKDDTNTPLTNKSNHSVEIDTISFSIFFPSKCLSL